MIQIEEDKPQVNIVIATRHALARTLELLRPMTLEQLNDAGIVLGRIKTGDLTEIKLTPDEEKSIFE